MAVVFKNRIPVAMTRTVGVLLARGQSGGSPDHSAFFIAQIDRFRLRVRHRIVVPRRKAVGLAVSLPGEAEAALAHHGSEPGVGHHIHPGCGRVDAGLQINGILFAVRGEPAQSVEVRQVKEG